MPYACLHDIFEGLSFVTKLACWEKITEVEEEKLTVESGKLKVVLKFYEIYMFNIKLILYFMKLKITFHCQLSTVNLK